MCDFIYIYIYIEILITIIDIEYSRTYTAACIVGGLGVRGLINGWI